MDQPEGELELDAVAAGIDETGADESVAARIPQVHELFRPLLEILDDGAAWNIAEASEAVADRIGLDPEARALTLRSGRLVFENRIRWTFTSLSKAELVDLVGPSTIQMRSHGHGDARDV
jgi:restriction endonuclease Mrr